MHRWLPAILLLFLVPAGAWADDEPEYPLDDVYREAKPEPLGTAAGQLRIHAAAGAHLTRENVDPEVLLGFESMLSPWWGLSFDASHRFATDTRDIWQLRTGPSFHLLPHRIVDISAGFEGGLSRFQGAWVPSASTRASLIVTPSAYFFVELQSRYDWLRGPEGQNAEGPGAAILVGWIL